MDRTEWLKQMRAKTEALYDQIAPLYWERYGVSESDVHGEFLEKLLERVPPGSTLLSAGCGAGQHDGVLLDAGHRVVGIDLSEGMLARARERFPGARYEKKGVQEMDFRDEFDGATCIEVEHVFPEDWPLILRGFRQALKPNGVLYLTVSVLQTDLLEEAYWQAKARGLPVVLGEVADEVDALMEQVMAVDPSDLPDKLGDRALDRAVYHYYPPMDEVSRWLAEESFAIEAHGASEWFRHLLVRQRGKA